MKKTYPIVLTPDEKGFIVYIPDFNINTEGNSLTEAIEMARDAIGLMGIDMEDDGKSLPCASSVNDIEHDEGEIISLVDVDFTEYRTLAVDSGKCKVNSCGICALCSRKTLRR